MSPPYDPELCEVKKEDQSGHAFEDNHDVGSDASGASSDGGGSRADGSSVNSIENKPSTQEENRENKKEGRWSFCSKLSVL